MEPPAKRLRILRSIEVDETNPDYVDAKQKQEQKFKGRLESIFAKFEKMHDSMSDEIDMMGNGEIVVDRGHMRRLARQVDRKETVLLDTLGLGNDAPAEDSSEDEEVCEDSEDELAPTQLLKKSSAQKEQNKHRNSTEDGAQSSPSSSDQHESQSLQPAPATSIQNAELVAPQTPNPAANLLQLVRFPQTPAGQQAQASFYTTLAQTINHAVQQAVAPLFSSILPNTPAVQLPFPTALPLSAALGTSADKVAPARDPKWFFPPLSEDLRESQVAQSNPTTTFTSPCIQGKQADGSNKKRKSDRQQDSVALAAVVQPEDLPRRKSKRPSRPQSPRVEIQHTTARRATYKFTEAEDVYIARRRELYGHTWAQIRDSKKKWSNWPLPTFHRRWAKHLSGKNLHLKDHSVPRDNIGGRATALPTHHLPTPSSSEQEDNTPVAEMATSTNEHTKSSSTHFDADDCDLLSLPGTDLDEEHLVVDNVEEETFFPDANEMILPSVELTAFVDEDALQQGLLEGSPMEANDDTTDTIKVEPSPSSSSGKQKQTRTSVAYQALSDLDTEVDDGEHVSREASLQEGQNDPDSEGRDKCRSTSASIDLVGDDELQAAAPTITYIKREFSTPPPTSFLYSTPAAQSHSRSGGQSSGVKSASGLSRKAYLKQVKQSWTKKSTPAPKTVTKRKSFHIVPMKRAWIDDTASDDELGF